MTWNTLLYKMNSICEDLQASVLYLRLDVDALYEHLDAGGKEDWIRVSDEITSLDELHSRMLELIEREANK